MEGSVKRMCPLCLSAPLTLILYTWTSYKLLCYPQPPVQVLRSDSSANLQTKRQISRSVCYCVHWTSKPWVPDPICSTRCVFLPTEWALNLITMRLVISVLFIPLLCPWACPAILDHCSSQGWQLGERIDASPPPTPNPHNTFWYCDTYPARRKLPAQYQLDFSIPCDQSMLYIQE